MSAVLFDVTNHVATITLNRPENLNTLGDELREELIAAWERVKEDDDIRVAVITGAGKHFCAGMDIKAAAQRAKEGTLNYPPDRTDRRQNYLPADVQKPVIAAVNGAAAGGGLGIVLACDIIIASEDAIFISPFAARGTLSIPILTMLIRKVPVGWANWMNFSGARVDAQSALRVGLVNEVLPKEELVNRALEMAELIAKNSKATLLAIKEKTAQVVDHTVSYARQEEGPYQKAQVELGEAAEGFIAFVEKRQAQFS